MTEHGAAADFCMGKPRLLRNQSQAGFSTALCSIVAVDLVIALERSLEE